MNLNAIQQAKIEDLNAPSNEVIFGLPPGSGSVDLSDATFAGIFTSGPPNLSLDFSDSIRSIDDVYTLDLSMAKTGTLRRGANIIDNNVNITTGSVDLVGSGVTLNLTNQADANNDQITVNMSMDQTVSIVRDGNPIAGTHDVSTGTGLAGSFGYRCWL